MRPQLDEDLVQRVHDLGPTAFSGTCFRHVSGQRNPLSGVGARLNGGRWNPVGLSTIYLAIPVGACMANSPDSRSPRTSPPTTCWRPAPAGS